MNRRLLLAAGLAALALQTAPASAQQGPVGELRPRIDEPGAAVAPLAGGERAAALALANQSLNTLQRLQGRFIQVAADGSRSTGAFYLQRPGRLRFEYDPPATLLIVSDGSVVSLRDTALRTTERTPLRSTPLNLILRANVDLERVARVERVVRSGPWLLVTARDRSGQNDARITLHFYGETAELRSWDVIDAVGGRTRVTLINMERPEALDARLFRLEDMLSERPGRRR